MKLFTIDTPTGWADILVRAVKVLLVAFVVLQMKEWFDAGTFDTPATALDAAMIAGGTLVLNAIFMLASPTSSRDQPLVQPGASPER
jgi:hypothetical protein